MRAPEWPQDCEFQLVGFAPTAKVCDVVWTEQLAQDIGMALKKISESRVLADKKPDWYHRLARYAKGATDANLVEKFIMRADPAQSE
jgi:hypothetical protein